MIIRGSYKIEPIEDMGSGTFGYVQKVRVFNQKDHFCGYFAMKTMTSDFREIENFRRRFMREGHLQAKCSHPNIVQIFICNLEADQPWFVMELGEIDVEKIIISEDFPRRERLECILHLLLGTDHIHKLNLLHRDIKPSNMVKVGDKYKIADFGLVKDMVSNPETTPLTAIGQGMGTPGFLAPEAVFGHYSQQSDIYAIGTFLQFVCHCDNELFKKLSPIINKCRAHVPGERYQSVEQILKSFLPIYEEGNNVRVN